MMQIPTLNIFGLAKGERNEKVEILNRIIFNNLNLFFSIAHDGLPTRLCFAVPDKLADIYAAAITASGGPAGPTKPHVDVSVEARILREIRELTEQNTQFVILRHGVAEEPVSAYCFQLTQNPEASRENVNLCWGRVVGGCAISFFNKGDRLFVYTPGAQDSVVSRLAEAFMTLPIPANFVPYPIPSVATASCPGPAPMV